MMFLSSPPRSASTPYGASDQFPPSQHMYQAVADFSPLYSHAQPQTLSSYRPRRRVTVVRRPAGCNLVRPCTLASQITRMLLFNGCSAALSVIGALVVWTGAALAVVTMPLFGCVVLVFRGLLHVVFYLCCTDAFIYNALAASAADCIDMDLAEWGPMTSSDELHPLLPIRVPPPLGGLGAGVRAAPEVRQVAGLHVAPVRARDGVLWLLQGARGGDAAAGGGAGGGVLGFLIGDKRVPVHLDGLTKQYPFAVYTTAFGLLLVALAMLHGVTRVSKVVTRFFCCETVR